MPRAPDHFGRRRIHGPRGYTAGVKICAALLPWLLLGGQDPVKTSFAVLASFDYVEGKALPGEVTALDTKVVSISGFMQREVPGSGPVQQFLLINDACGCNGTPKLNEIVFCALPDGVTTDIKPGVVHVTGTLYVGEQREDGAVWAVYVLDADTIQ
jgi:hypothetical protein